MKWNAIDSNPKKLSNFTVLLLNPTAKYYYLFIESYFIPGLAVLHMKLDFTIKAN